jgi:hypothetical protein
MITMISLLTLSDLRKHFGKPSHQINHAIERYGPEPAYRVGMTRVWVPEQLDDIRDSLQKTSGRNRFVPETAR